MEFALRPYATAAVALVGASLIAVTPVAAPLPGIQVRAVQLAAGDDIGLIIGGSGTPIPGTAYVGAAEGLYLNNPDAGVPTPHLPTFPNLMTPGVLANGLFTPEGAYPLFGGTGVKTLPFNYPFDSNGFPAQSTSVGQGMTILENNIQANYAAGDISTVFGYSQSAVISSLVMQQLAGHIPQGDLQFVLIGDLSAPNGGILERFNGFETLSGHTTVLPLNLSSLNFAFDGATPDDAFATTIYSLEYDGWTDFPRYPLNLLSDLNAFLGIAQIHGLYLNQEIPGRTGGPTTADIAHAVLLPGSQHSLTDACTDGCLTNYYMIDTIDGQQVTPPLVSLLGSIPLIGKPLEDLLGPDLTALINLGYGNPDFGYSTDPANIPTPFGLLPSLSDLAKLPGALWDGTIKGFTDLFNDLLHPAAADAATATATAVATAPTTAFSSLSDFINALSGAASSLYAAVLPTADIINSLVSSIPAYDVSLIWDNLMHGDLLDAIGLPFAANMAMFTLAGGIELEVVMNAIKLALSYF